MYIISLVLTTLLVLSVAQAEDLQPSNKILGQVLNLNSKYAELDKSLAGLNRYRDQMSRTHRIAENMGLQKMLSTITLSDSLPVDDVVDLILDYNLQPKLVYVFAKSAEDDEIITIGIRPDISDLAHSVHLVVESFKEDSGAEALGVVAVIGYIDASQLHAAKLDNRIFLIDISADEKLANNPGNKQYMHHFGWDLYHLQ